MEYVKAKVHFRILILSRALKGIVAPKITLDDVEITERCDLVDIRLTV